MFLCVYNILPKLSYGENSEKLKICREKLLVLLIG